MANRVETIMSFRHGRYKRNDHIDGKSSKSYSEPENPDDTMNLSRSGRKEIVTLRRKAKLTRSAIDACFYSPYLRTDTSAHLAFRWSRVPLISEYRLRERHLGRFATMPRAQFHDEHAESYAEKRKYPLDWPSDDNEVETLREVGDLRVTPLLDEVDRHFPGGTVVFATHADVMIAMRSLPQLGAMTNEKLRQPLTDTLQNPQWIQNAQLDIYTRRDPEGGLASDMRYFRSITTADTQYDTGWLEIAR